MLASINNSQLGTFTFEVEISCRYCSNKPGGYEWYELQTIGYDTDLVCGAPVVLVCQTSFEHELAYITHFLLPAVHNMKESIMRFKIFDNICCQGLGNAHRCKWTKIYLGVEIIKPRARHWWS